MNEHGNAGAQLVKSIALLFFIWMISAFSTEAFASRAMYWNATQAEVWGKNGELFEATLDKIHSYGVDEVHIWINANELPDKCVVFDWVTSGLWKPDPLLAFVQALQQQKIGTVLTMSPAFQNKATIASFAAPNGPFEIAHKAGDIPVEFDLEGNWSNTRQRCRDIPREGASKALVDALHGLAPKSKVIMSTNRGSFGDHLDFLRVADEIAPQLYDSPYALPGTKVGEDFEYFKAKSGGLPLLPALSVECRPESSQAHKCSQEIYEAGLKNLRTSQRCGTSGRELPYIVWALYEARLPSEAISIQKGTGKKFECPTWDKVCSTWGDAYLKASAANPKIICGAQQLRPQ